MGIPLFLAMTAGELLNAQRLPDRPAWMACHFSPYGTGLSNVPKTLPEGAMLILNDRMPPDRHDPQLAADIMSKTAEQLHCDCILLDFQRPFNDQAAAVAQAVLNTADCPVGISSSYAQALPCPVLLPPVLPHIPLTDALAPWKNREVWLELSLEAMQIKVTANGSQYTPLPYIHLSESAHIDPSLHSHYEITTEEDQVIFQLGRTGEDLSQLLETAQAYNVTKAVGLWQELSLHFPKWVA